MSPVRASVVRASVLALLTCSVLTLTFPLAVHAGGAWVPAPGDGDVQLGYSRKTADHSWSSRGDSLSNPALHDFRYSYISGEIGVMKRFSFLFLMTHLDGLEGPPGDLERNNGPSDAWFGMKYRLKDGEWPMALGLTIRTPIFYDIQGPYTRDLYNDDGEFVGHSPEWRGLNKSDLTLSYYLSRSLWDGRGWMSFETGYTWREGAPADHVPFVADVGLPLNWQDMRFKVAVVYIQALGNDSARDPYDRFGSRVGFNFNNASMARIGGSFILPFGRDDKWSFEAGFNQWLWGKSARKYEEPFFSLGRRF